MASPGDLPNPEIKPGSPALQVDSLPTELSGSPLKLKLKVNSRFPALILDLSTFLGFPDSSVGKESTCNAGDPSLISGSGRFAGEGMGYPLQYSWASLVAQLVKNLLAM